MKLRYKLLLGILLILCIILGVFVYHNVNEVNQVKHTGKKIQKTGMVTTKWFRTEKAFHFLITFEKEEYIAHSNSIFFGAVHPGDILTIECYEISPIKCGNAKLLKVEPGKVPHKH